MAGGLQAEIKLICSVGIIILFVSCSKSTENVDNRFCTDSLQSGDIILRRGYGLVSDAIVAQLKDTVDISHCGILIRDSKNRWFVIHSLSRKVSDVDGMQLCSLDKFINESQPASVQIVRFRSDKDSLIALGAIHYLNKKIPFDDKFDINDTTAFYCGELPVHVIYSYLKTDIMAGKDDFKFSVFYNPKYFTIVYKK